MKVDFFRHDLTAADASRVADVLASPFITSGAVVREVEAQLCAFFATSEALLVNSWTNGALAGLLALGVGPGDEVIVPSMTFIATANMPELIGARPVFTDVDAATLLMTPDTMAAALTERTKAVIPVHLYGQMCDVRGIRARLDSMGRADIRILEDAAHCFEGNRQGDGPGMYSDLAVFSFYATKNVTCGEGGAIVCRDPALADLLRQTRLHGMTAGAADRFKAGRYRHWDMARLGVKANLPDLLAALLGPQIASIRDRLPHRQRMADRYREAFAGTGIRMQCIERDVASAEHIFPIHVPGEYRDGAIAALNEAGIGVAVNYNNVPTRSYYRNRYGYDEGSFPVAEAWGQGTLTLPLFPSMSASDQDYVIDQVLALVAPSCAGRLDLPAIPKES